MQRILVALDGSAESERILDEVLRVAPRDAALDLLHVVPAFNHEVPGAGYNLEDLAGLYLESVAERLADRKVRTTIWRGVPEEEIPKAARMFNADLLALTTHARRGVSHLLLGSVAEVVVRNAPVPVLMTRPGVRMSKAPLQRILVPFDGTEGSGDVIDTARDLAAGHDAELLLLQVVTPIAAGLATLGLPPPPADPTPSLEEQVGRLVQRGLRARAVVAHGTPADQILEQARKLKADLIAMATSGRKGLSRLLMGSVAEDVVRRMDRTVLLHRIAPRSEVLQWSQEQHAPGSD
jgi:nucleotide-binding universal stress UspA family protein